MRRVMSVWLPNWPITRLKRIETARQRLPSSATPDRPLAIVDSLDGVMRLAAVNDEAAAQGLKVGQKLTDARAILPLVVTADADPMTDRQALAGLAEWCTHFTPSTAIDPPDGLWLDMTGLAHLWGGEAELAQDIIGQLSRLGIPARAAMADSFGAAWAVLRHQKKPSQNSLIVPPGTQKTWLQALPVASLRVMPETLISLHKLGLRRVGQLLRFSRGDLARRFGGELTLRLDQALGEAEEPIDFRQTNGDWFTRQAFAEPLATREDLTHALECVTGLLCQRLNREAMGARRFEAGFHRVDGTVARLAVGMALPNRTASRIAHLLAQKLETIDPGFGVEIVTLMASDVEALAAAQLTMPHSRRHGSVSLPDFIENLGNRLGFDRLWRHQPQESYLPERAVGRIAATAVSATENLPASQPRPIRLLRHPEPIDAIAPIPDDPPIQFNWRKVTHRVRRAEGPERIAYEWWRQEAPADRAETDLIRDYYRVENSDGRRFWIYRAGLYTEGRPARWYLHGFFA